MKGAVAKAIGWPLILVAAACALGAAILGIVMAFQSSSLGSSDVRDGAGFIIVGGVAGLVLGATGFGFLVLARSSRPETAPTPVAASPVYRPTYESARDPRRGNP